MPDTESVEAPAPLAIPLENHRAFLKYLERRVGGTCAEHGCRNCTCQTAC
jgi:hypothetical protein